MPVRATPVLNRTDWPILAVTLPVEFTLILRRQICLFPVAGRKSLLLELQDAPNVWPHAIPWHESCISLFRAHCQTTNQDNLASTQVYTLYTPLSITTMCRTGPFGQRPMESVKNTFIPTSVHDCFNRLKADIKYCHYNHNCRANTKGALHSSSDRLVGTPATSPNPVCRTRTSRQASRNILPILSMPVFYTHGSTPFLFDDNTVADSLYNGPVLVWSSHHARCRMHHK